MIILIQVQVQVHVCGSKNTEVSMQQDIHVCQFIGRGLSGQFS